MPADMNDYFKKRKPASNDNNQPSKDKTPKDENGGSSNNKQNYIIIALFVLFGLYALKPFAIINSGEVGIKINTGKFEEKPLQPGLHFFVPVLQKIVPVNTRIRMITYSNQNHQSIDDGYARYEGGLRRNPAIRVMDSRGLDVYIDLAVQYNLRPQMAPKTIATWGTAWEDKIVNTKVREIVRDVIGKYTAENLPQKRQEIASEIQKQVRAKIESIPGKPVILDSVELRDIELPAKIKAKIEELQAEKQNVMIAEQQKERAKREAERKAEIARGEAQKRRIEAQGKADQITIEAQAQAKANKIIANSLTSDLLQLEQIKAQLQFNEALKVNKDAQIFLTPGGAVPNIWVDAKGKDQKRISTQQ
jgi:regulator of protease activity HflC (stomatin/prohibitin superfamily)